MKLRHLAAIGLTAYALGIIATAPATLIDASLQSVSQGKLRLTESQGSLWAGSGQIEIRDPNGRAGVAKSVSWHMQPASLLLGRLLCEVKLDQTNKPFVVAISLSGIEMSNADMVLPATALGLGMPELAPLGLTGGISLHVAHLLVERKQMRGNATLQWRDAGSVFTPVSPLGDYELNVDGEGAMVHALLRTIKGPLQIDGNGSWESVNKPRFMAIARVPLEYRQQLGSLLRLIAVERGAGTFELQLK